MGGIIANSLVLTHGYEAVFHMELDSPGISSIFRWTTGTANVADVIADSDPKTHRRSRSRIPYENFRRGFSTVRVPYIFPQYEVEIRGSTAAAEK